MSRTYTRDQGTPPELLRDALAYVSPDLDRDSWVKVGMSIHAVYPGPDGLALFTEWSRPGASFSESACALAWRSIQPGPVTEAHLLALAKRNGFDVSAWRAAWRQQQDSGQRPSAATVAQLEAQRQQREAQHQQAQQQRLQAQQQAAAVARRRWDAARPDGASPYLQRKRVRPHGVRFEPGEGGDSLLVPVRDADGTLHNVQVILPTRPAQGPDKLFLKGGRKSGLFHLIPATALQADAPVLLLAEGYATGATLHEASGFAVAIAFDAGNLPNVAQALAQSQPGCHIVVCGDDDRATPGNPGRTRATAAAQAVAGLAVFPTDGVHALPDGLSDFNDLACWLDGHAGAGAGHAAVRDILDSALAHLVHDDPVARRAALATPSGTATPPDEPGADEPADDETADDAAVPGDAAADPADGSTSAPPWAGDDAPRDGPDDAPQGPPATDEAGASPAPGAARPARGRPRKTGKPDDLTLGDFVLNDDGLFQRQRPSKDNPEPAPRRICARLDVLGIAHTEAHAEGLLVLAFEGAGVRQRLFLPMGWLVADGRAYREALASLGFRVPVESREAKALTGFLMACGTSDHRRPGDMQPPALVHTPRVGWHSGPLGDVFVLPDTTLAPAVDEAPDAGTLSAGQVVFHAPGGAEARFRQAGTLATWQGALSALAVGNSRLAFAVSLAFAAPLLRFFPHVGGGGFGLVGATSSGKTTALLLACSVWGRAAEGVSDSYLQKWRATGNGLESLGEQHNDGLLCLDELAQMDAREVGPAVYMLADGSGKNRARAQGGSRALATWRLFFLSSGEVSLAQHMETANQKMRGGQETRLVTLPAEVSPGTSFEALHGHATPQALAEHIKRQGARVYGCAGMAWLRLLVDQHGAIVPRIRDALPRILSDWMQRWPLAGGAVHRVAQRMSFIAACAEEASALGLTGWPAGEATRAAAACFEAWVNERGGAGSGDEAAMLSQVRAFIEGAGAGLVWAHRSNDAHAPQPVKMLGYKVFADVHGALQFKLKRQFENEEIDDEVRDGWTRHALVHVEAFRTIACAGYDWKTVQRVLVDRGWLLPQGKDMTRSCNLPGVGKVRLYHLTDKVLSD